MRSKLYESLKYSQSITEKRLSTPTAILGVQTGRKKRITRVDVEHVESTKEVRTRTQVTPEQRNL